MRVVKSRTYLGKRLLSTAQNYEGIYLYEVYGKWSEAKEKAWNKCYNEYCTTEGSELFAICSHNNFGFSCAWFTPDGMRIETPYNSYLVVFGL